MSLEKLTQGMILPTKIVVREIKPQERKTENNIILPSVGRSTQTKGEILLVGEGTPQVKMIAKVGWTALFAPLSAQKFDIDGEEFLLVEQSQILFFFPPAL